jgi:hypothetical protein
MQPIPTQMATSIANAWLNEVPLHQITAAAQMEHVAVMDVVRGLRLPDRHPTTRQIYPGTSHVE